MGPGNGSCCSGQPKPQKISVDLTLRSQSVLKGSDGGNRRCGSRKPSTKSSQFPVSGSLDAPFRRSVPVAAEKDALFVEMEAKVQNLQAQISIIESSHSPLTNEVYELCMRIDADLV